MKYTFYVQALKRVIYISREKTNLNWVSNPEPYVGLPGMQKIQDSIPGSR